MPSDLDFTDSQFDKDSFPIAIGFQPAEAGEREDALDFDVNQAELGSDLIVPEASVVSSSDDANEDSGREEVLTGYELVTDMMRRQDDVLRQLDDLNARIELAIEEISAARKSEIEALEAQGQQLEEDEDRAMNQPKAA